MSDIPNNVPYGTKETIDAHSGRFEFFKQALTLGTAGLAGTAALFTDQSRVPTDLASQIMVCGLGLSLTAVVAAAMMGLSTYANLLTAVARSSNPLPPGLPSKPNPKTPHQCADGVIHHARLLFISLAAASVFILGFASFKLFTPSDSLEAAIMVGRQLVVRESGGGTSTPQVETINVERDRVIITYSRNSVLFRVSVAREDNKILDFLRQPGAGVQGGVRP